MKIVGLLLVLFIPALYVCVEVISLCSELGLTLEKFRKPSWPCRALQIFVVAILVFLRCA